MRPSQASDVVPPPREAPCALPHRAYPGAAEAARHGLQPLPDPLRCVAEKDSGMLYVLRLA